MPDRDAWKKIVTPELRQRYVEDGVILIPKLLDEGWLKLIEQGIMRNVRYPGPESKIINPESPGAWFTDICNYLVIPEFQYVVQSSPIADVMCSLLDTNDLWLYYEQTLVKSGGNCERTSWHQDLPYWLVDGPKLGSIWISIDPLKKEHCLEFVPKSHVGPLYGSVDLKTNDQSVDVLTYAKLPPVPNVDAERDRWQPISWDVEPGDVIISHPAALHGGAGTGPDNQRRTVSFRFYGEGSVMTDRFADGERGTSPHFYGIEHVLKPGDPFMDARFPKIR